MQNDSKNAFKALLVFVALLPVFRVNRLQPREPDSAGLTFNNFQKIINKLGGECRVCSLHISQEFFHGFFFESDN